MADDRIRTSEDGARLLVSKDGTRLVINCEAAPEPPFCAWCPCNQPGCWLPRRMLWIRADVLVCGFTACGGNQRTVLYDDWCYTHFGLLPPRPREEIPPGDPIITPANADLIACIGDELVCADPRCVPEGGGDCPCECPPHCYTTEIDAQGNCSFCHGGDLIDPETPNSRPTFDWTYTYTHIVRHTWGAFTPFLCGAPGPACRPDYSATITRRIVRETIRFDCVVCKEIEERIVSTEVRDKPGGGCETIERDDVTATYEMCLVYGDPPVSGTNPSFDARGPCQEGCDGECGTVETWSLQRIGCNLWEHTGETWSRSAVPAFAGGECACDLTVTTRTVERLTYIPGLQTCPGKCREVHCGDLVSGGMDCNPTPVGSISGGGGILEFA